MIRNELYSFLIHVVILEQRSIHEKKIRIDHRRLPRYRPGLCISFRSGRIFCIYELHTFRRSIIKKQLLADGYLCEAVPGDAGHSADVAQMFSSMHEICDGPDVLVNNAGISYIGLLTDMTDQDWEEILHSNLSSAFYCSRAALPYMISQKRGKIINISSMWGRVGASCEAAYSASKAGLNGLTMALAKELAPSNIQVNAIACGVIDTAMNAGFSGEERSALMEEVPAGRFGTPEETADLVYDLAENHPYLTGQIIGLDGGMI